MPISPIHFSLLPPGSSGSIFGDIASGLNSAYEGYQKDKARAIEQAVQKLQAQKLEAEKPTWAEAAQASLQKAKEDANHRKLENQFYSQKAQSDINEASQRARQHKAEADKLEYLASQGYTTDEQKSQIELHKKQATLYEQQSNKIKQEIEDSKKLSDMQSEQSQSGGIQGGSIYGIPTPTLTSQDIYNKKKYGIDTYSHRANNVMAQQQGQLKAIDDSVKQSEDAINAINIQQEKFNQYDNLMDKSWEAGPISGLSPFPKFGSGREIQQLINEMSLFGLQNVRSAMGGSIRNIPEYQTAMGTKPLITWGKETRENYANTLAGTKKRLTEISNIKRAVKNNPQLGIGDSELKSIINAYNDTYPLVYESGSNKGKINWENISGDKWQQFLKPENIKKILNGEKIKPNKQEGVVNVVRDASGKLRVEE